MCGKISCIYLWLLDISIPIQCCNFIMCLYMKTNLKLWYPIYAIKNEVLASGRGGIPIPILIFHSNRMRRERPKNRGSKSGQHSTRFLSASEAGARSPNNELSSESIIRKDRAIYWGNGGNDTRPSAQTTRYQMGDTKAFIEIFTKGAIRVVQVFCQLAPP